VKGTSLLDWILEGLKSQKDLYETVQALKEIGSAAARDDILSQLAVLLRDENWDVRDAAASVFKRWHSQGLRIIKDTALKACSVKELSRLEP
jgi:hypothetical protein